MRQALIFPLLILAGLAVFSFVTRPQTEEPYSFISGATPALQAAQAYLLPVAAPAYAPTRNTTVADPAVDANSALLLHVESGGVLFEKNPDVHVPIASLTKLLTALVASDLFDGQEVVTVASASVRVDGIRQTLYEGERMSVGNLISMLLVESSNDAAYALSDYAKKQGIDLIAAMNRRAAAIGMDGCMFTDPAGLDDAAFCSASDLSRLVRSALLSAPHIWPVMTVSSLTIQSADGRFVHELKSTNELLGTVDGIIGGKTGYTDGALGCLILVVKLSDKGDTLVSVVLGSRGRFADTRTLVSWARAAYRWQ